MGDLGNVDGVVLVHGGHHDKSCWQLMLPLMGVPTIAVDLPGRGARPADDQPVTIADCAAAVLADADAAGFDHFVLVGHSMGGLTISRVGLDAPERVAHLVYVGALAPPAGANVGDVLQVPIGAGAADSAMLPVPPDDVARSMFGNDMTDEQWAIAHGCIVPEPVGMFRDSLPGLPTGIPITYVQMTDDMPVPLALAAQMIERLGADVDVRTIEAGHNVMLSQPTTLAELLDDIAGRLAPD